MTARVGMIIFTVVALSTCAPTNAQDGKNKVSAPGRGAKALATSSIGIDLETVIRSADKAVKEAEGVSVAQFPDLKSIEVSVNGTVAKDGSGKVKFLVFSIGGGKSTERSSTLTFELKRPPAPAAKTQSADQQKWEQAVGEAIARAKEGFAAANRATDRLKTEKVEIEIAFAVKKNVSGGLDTADLIPIGFELEGKVEKGQIHTLKLTFGGSD